MKQYLDVLKDIRENGHPKPDRTGTGTLATFGQQMRFKLYDGFPLVTTKKLHLKSIIHELLWFLQGDTNVKYLNDNGVTIWDAWADENGELGPIYGKQWRDWKSYDKLRVSGGSGYHIDVDQGIDQISEVMKLLENDPFSRRIIVNAWNVGELKNMSLTPCFAPRQKVRSAKGYKHIEDLTVGDFVLTHDGSFQPVVKKFKTIYEDKCYCIKPWHSLPIEVTKDHPFLTQNGWKKASQLTTDDYLKINRNKNSSMPIFTYKRQKTFNKKTKKFEYENIEHTLTQHHMYMLGYFLGDGWVNHNMKCPSTTKNKFYFSISDSSAHKILPKLKKAIPNKLLFKMESGKSKVFYSTCPKIAPIMREFGRKAHNKKIPHWVVDMPENMLKSFIEGYLDADGCTRNNRHIFMTTSYDVALGLQEIYAKIGKILSVSKIKRSKKYTICGRQVNQRHLYCCQNTYDRKNKSPLHVVSEDAIWIKVRHAAHKSKYSKYVYNISVGNNHTYTINNIVNHNCHCMFQFFVREPTSQEEAMWGHDKLRLSCMLTQRSCDFFLGVPFNIASYALLTMMIAQCVDMVPDEFIWSGGDTHLYLNHLNQADEQLKRIPYKLPYMRINPDVTDIFSFKYEDFELIDYKCYPSIKAPISV